MWTTALIVLGSLLTFMTVLWFVSLRLENASIVDVFWGPGFALSAWGYLALAPEVHARGLLVATLLSIWAIRLAVHIGGRSLGRGEDYRYREMRRSANGSFALRSLFVVFGLQAVLVWVISAPVAAVILGGASSLTAMDLVATVVFLTGLGVEAVADWQLARFTANPESRGRAFDGGLWRYSRHPNYFGDAVLWWGVFGFALSSGAWWSIFAPVLMTLLLLRVSGVALLEKTIVERRPEYRSYIDRTSAFVPWFPRGEHA